MNYTYTINASLEGKYGNDVDVIDFETLFFMIYYFANVSLNIINKQIFLTIYDYFNFNRLYGLFLDFVFRWHFRQYFL